MVQKLVRVKAVVPREASENCRAFQYTITNSEAVKQLNSTIDTLKKIAKSLEVDIQDLVNSQNT